MAKYITIFVFVSLIIFGNGCSKDENVNEQISNPLIGSWLLTKITKIYTNGDTEYPTGELGRIITFNSDNTYSSNEGHQGTWSTSGGILTLIPTQGDVDQTEVPYEVNGNKFIITIWDTEYRWIEEYTRR